MMKASGLVREAGCVSGGLIEALVFAGKREVEVRAATVPMVRAVTEPLVRSRSSSPVEA